MKIALLNSDKETIATIEAEVDYSQPFQPEEILRDAAMGNTDGMALTLKDVKLPKSKLKDIEGAQFAAVAPYHETPPTSRAQLREATAALQNLQRESFAAARAVEVETGQKIAELQRQANVARNNHLGMKAYLEQQLAIIKHNAELKG